MVRAHTALAERTQVWFLGFMSGGSQLLVNSSSRGSDVLLWLSQLSTLTCLDSDIHTHMINFLKTKLYRKPLIYISKKITRVEMQLSTKIVYKFLHQKKNRKD